MFKEYYNNLSIRGKLLIILIIIFTILVLLRFITREDKSDKIGNYLISKGFIKEEDSTLYHKQLSDMTINEYEDKVNNKQNSTYEMLYFNTNNYNYMKDKMTYEDDISKSFNPTYNYKDNTLTYVYRINMYNTNIIIEGEYDTNTEEFTCNSTFASEINIDNAENDICDSIKYDVIDFSYEALTLITSTDILNDMKK